jgi:hypothetical protein
MEAARVVSLPSLLNPEGDRLVRRAASMIGAPDGIWSRLPFDSTFFSFNTSVDDCVAWMKGNGACCVNLGLLITRAGLCFNVVLGWTDEKDESSANRDWVVFPICVSDSDGVSVDGFEILWILWAHIEAMEHHQVRPLSRAASFAHRRAAQQAKSPARPWYEVDLGGSLVRARLDRMHTEQRQWTHRWDVRQHRRLLLQRGPTPCEPQLATRLKMRGYEFARHDDPEIDLSLAERGLPKHRDGEWLAIRWVLVSDHIRGPENLPYVPGLRVSSQKIFSNP